MAADARALLVNPPGYGDACAALIATLAQAGQFDTNDLLAQLRLAGEQHATGPARRTAALLGASDTRAAQAVDLPALAMARGIGAGRVDHEIYLVAIGRMARTSLKLAAVALQKNAPQLSAQELAIGWASIALAASMTLAPERLRLLAEVAPARRCRWTSCNGRPASRCAQGDWKMVKADHRRHAAAAAQRSGLDLLAGRARWRPKSAPAASRRRRCSRASPTRTASTASWRWRNWASRCRSRRPARAVTPAEMAPMAANPGLRRALKFFSLRLRFEGTREWNWELRKFSERELLAAAEFARQNEILDRMVNTSERTRTEFDYTQRFPAPHNEILQPTTQSLGLDRAWVYGLIRQESRFIMDARSGVGASGLMQVMPSTGAVRGAKRSA